jgi:hypothetical protein
MAFIAAFIYTFSCLSVLLPWPLLLHSNTLFLAYRHRFLHLVLRLLTSLGMVRHVGMRTSVEGHGLWLRHR